MSESESIHSRQLKTMSRRTNLCMLISGQNLVDSLLSKEVVFQVIRVCRAT